MRILGFDTATRATAVALDLPGERVLEARDDPPPGARPGHATRLMPLAAELLDGSGIGWGDLDRIAVGVGPGTFTGLRIGVSTARALARATATPLVAVSTLQSLALGAAAPQQADVHRDRDCVLAVIDARRGEVFAAGWAIDEVSRRQAALLAPFVAPPESVAAALVQLGRAWLAVGDGAVEFRQVLERCARIPADSSRLHRVSAIQHCRLARGLPTADPDEVRPEYLRLPDAEITRRATRSR